VENEKECAERVAGVALPLRCGAGVEAPLLEAKEGRMRAEEEGSSCSPGAGTPPPGASRSCTLSRYSWQKERLTE
jgi:hypothetical protein